MTTQMIDKSNFDERQYKADIDSAYECGRASVLSVIEDIKAEIHRANCYYHGTEWGMGIELCERIIDKHIGKENECL